MTEDVTLSELNRRLQAIEVRLDRLLDDHEVRLRKVERWVYAIPPTLLIAAATAIAAVVKAG